LPFGNDAACMQGPLELSTDGGATWFAVYKIRATPFS
jgi:hypothetical protein